MMEGRIDWPGYIIHQTDEFEQWVSVAGVRVSSGPQILAQSFPDMLGLGSTRARGEVAKTVVELLIEVHLFAHHAHQYTLYHYTLPPSSGKKADGSGG